MILVDTNIWVNHLHRPEPVLVEHLARDEVLMHPYIRGEIMLGSLASRSRVEAVLSRLLVVLVATQDEVLRLIEAERLFGTGLGYVDVHLLASLRLTPDVPLWTRDQRLRAQARRLGLAVDLD